MNLKVKPVSQKIQKSMVMMMTSQKIDRESLRDNAELTTNYRTNVSSLNELPQIWSPKKIITSKNIRQKPSIVDNNDIFALTSMNSDLGSFENGKSPKKRKYLAFQIEQDREVKTAKNKLRGGNAFKFK